MSVDDAHAIVRNALEGVEEEGTPGLHELRLAELSDSERKRARVALRALHDLDGELAERSGFEPLERPWTEDVGGDV
jgi:hypothetical protein